MGRDGCPITPPGEFQEMYNLALPGQQQKVTQVHFTERDETGYIIKILIFIEIIKVKKNYHFAQGQKIKFLSVN